MRVIKNGHRARFMERLPWVDVTYCKYGTPYRKQTRLWTNMRWRPRRGLCRPAAAAARGRTAGTSARAAAAAADGGAVREGQPVTRAALQRSCCAVRQDCARGHGEACGAAEHSGLSLRAFSNPRSLEEANFPCFTGFFGSCHL